jgi:HSP20 family protein
MSYLTRYDPFREMRQMQRQMFDVFNRSILDWPRGEFGEDAVLMALNVRAVDDKIIVEASLPGVEQDNLDVRLNRDMLTIAAEVKGENEQDENGWVLHERRYGKFERSIRLPAEVQADKVQAELKNGVLTITLPRSEESTPKKIAVKATNLLTAEARKK